MRTMLVFLAGIHQKPLCLLRADVMQKKQHSMIQLTCDATYPPEALPSIGCAAKFVNPLGIGFVLKLTKFGYLSSHLRITLAIIRPEGWISVTTAWVLVC